MSIYSGINFLEVFTFSDPMVDGFGYCLPLLPQYEPHIFFENEPFIYIHIHVIYTHTYIMPILRGK